MSFLQSAGILVTLAIFTAASAIVWRAGSSLSRSADAIAERTGLGKAFVGVIFLGVATSLPVPATSGGLETAEPGRYADLSTAGPSALSRK